jgi:sulfonate transport system permease protein
MAPGLSRAGAGMLRALLGAAVLLGLWQAAALALAGLQVIPDPAAVARHIAQNAGLLARSAQTTLINAALGFVAGNLIAVALAFLVLLAPALRGFVSAIMLVVFCLPLVATGPILRVLYGPGAGPQITIAALAVSYTTLLLLLVGLRAAPAAWFDLVRLYGRGAWTAFVQVRLMAAVPYLVAGLQIGAPAAVLGAMVGEFTGAETGLGVLSLRAMAGIDAAATWSLALVAAGVSMVVYALFGWLGARLAPGRPEILLAAARPPGGGPWARAGLAALALAAVVALWWGAMEAVGLSRFFAKRPDDLWQFLVAAPTAEANRALLLAATAETLALAVPGWLAGLATGVALAMALVLMPALAGLALPVAVALRAVPIVTTAPLLVLALGRGVTGTVAIVAVMTFFPVFVACVQGLRQAPGAVLDIFASYGAGRLRQLALARFPAMLPALFAAARLSVPAAVLAVTVAEWLATGRGLGNLMALTSATSNYNMLWSAVVIATAASAAGYAAVGAVERVVLARLAPEQGRP